MCWSVDLTGGMTNTDWSMSNIGQILLVIWMLGSELCVFFSSVDITSGIDTGKWALCTGELVLLVTRDEPMV